MPEITEKLIRRAQSGNKEAITDLYTTFVDRIYRYIFYRVGDESDAQDLTSEVFMRMVDALPTYEFRNLPFESWLYRIASARIADLYRRKKNHHIELSDALASDDTEPELRIIHTQEVIHLRVAFLQLSTEEQTILVLRFVERKSHKQVAELLGKSMESVKAAQHRALLRLAHLLGEEKVKHYFRGSND